MERFKNFLDWLNPRKSMFSGFSVLGPLGDGTSAQVFKACPLEDQHDFIAIKLIKAHFDTWAQCLALREVRVLQHLPAHPHVVRLRQVIRENSRLFFVFDYHASTLLDLLADRRTPIPAELVLSFTRQIVEAVAFLHAHNVFHRDLKPENILVHQAHTLKVADFGQACFINQDHNQAPPLRTDYVATRWYRAPELLLRLPDYDERVDLWALACIVFEIRTLKPLFPGETELHQLDLITRLLGTPIRGNTSCNTAVPMMLAHWAREWNEGLEALSRKNMKLRRCPPGRPLGSGLESKLLRWDPKKRVSAADLLEMVRPQSEKKTSVSAPTFQVPVHVQSPQAQKSVYDAAEDELNALLGW